MIFKLTGLSRRLTGEPIQFGFAVSLMAYKGEKR